MPAPHSEPVVYDRVELLHVLMLPDFERADRIGEFWGNPKTRTFAELLIDCEEVIRHGGPRDGDSMGWVVIDRVPDDAEGSTFHFTGSDGTKADAEAKADQLRAEGGPG